MSKLETNTIDTVSGTSNLTIGGANNTGSTTIKSNNTAAITIDNSQNVGVGTTSPTTTLDVSGTASLGTDQTDFIKAIGGAGTSRIDAVGGNTNVNLSLATKGTGSVYFWRGGYGGTQNILIDGSTGRTFFGDAGTDANSGQGTGSNRLAVTLGHTFADPGVCINTGPHTGAYDQIRFRNGNGTVGNIRLSGSGTSYLTSSDYRLKQNLVDITDATDRVKQLQPKRFNFIADANTTVDGFVAHEVSSIVPEAVGGEKDAVDENGDIIPQGIDQSKLVPVLTKALQEAITKIEELETRIQTLENA